MVKYSVVVSRYFEFRNKARQQIISLVMSVGLTLSFSPSERSFMPLSTTLLTLASSHVQPHV